MTALILGALLLAPAQEPPLAFRDASREAGLTPHVTGMMGHAAGWGDVDSDGWADLYVGAFFQKGSKSNRFLRNVKGKFRLDGQEVLRVSGRPTGALFADLDNDGDLDLYVSSMPKAARGLAGCTLFRNDGGGTFTDISKGNGACPEAFGGRSATVLDYDGDGRLDLLVGEDPFPGYNGSKTTSSRLFHNEGGLRFKDVTRDAGIPAGVPALGVAAGDVNDDGRPDLFLACSKPGNRLFLNDGAGRFREAPAHRRLFAWEKAGGDDMVCGVCFGDLNGDGRLDIVIGQHFQQPWIEPVANRLYLNRGTEDGVPRFEDVTERAGLIPLPLKAPHVEIQDFDNDGRFDILTSIVTFADGIPHPLIFRNLGNRDSIPRFRQQALAVVDFPTAEDRNIRRSGAFFEKMIRDGKIIYAAPAPSCDYDRDGRLDVFVANWWMERPSMLLRNETKGGRWLEVAVEGTGAVNRMGIGSRVNLYEAGKAGDPAAFLACREIATGFGYASSQEAVAHFGMGGTARCDVEVVFPHGKGRVVRRDVPTNQRIVVKP